MRRSFSTTGSLEGAWVLDKGSFVSLNVQESVDCDTRDSGCNGDVQRFCVCRETRHWHRRELPIHRKTWHQAAQWALLRGGVVGFKGVTTDSEQSLVPALSQQPMSIATVADQLTNSLFNSEKHYSRGAKHVRSQERYDHFQSE